ncbi:MAG: hypothetical protein D4S01_10175 [Dehalococcoidia bacterium]|nr:MAG: hypothetical protein D4S01_10175 [Dehalococcoidia bacterium]
MGLGLIGSSCKDSTCNAPNCYSSSSIGMVGEEYGIPYDNVKIIAMPPNPDPKKFAIYKCRTKGEYTLLFLKYAGCTNYEGFKILLFKENVQTILTPKEIDPHFCDGDHPSPMARFEPTNEGWNLASAVMDKLANGDL